MYKRKVIKGYSCVDDSLILLPVTLAQLPSISSVLFSRFSLPDTSCQQWYWESSVITALLSVRIVWCISLHINHVSVCVDCLEFSPNSPPFPPHPSCCFRKSKPMLQKEREKKRGVSEKWLLVTVIKSGVSVVTETERDSTSRFVPDLLPDLLPSSTFHSCRWLWKFGVSNDYSSFSLSLFSSFQCLQH